MVLDVAALQGVQGVLQVLRVLAENFHTFSGGRVCKGQFSGVQPLPGEAEFSRKLGFGTVGEISGTGVLECGKMDADLVRASGFQMNLNEGCLAKGFQHLVPRH